MANPQDPPSLPTREQFLATRLVAVSPSAHSSISECGICMEEFKAPVNLGCHPAHVFCHDCIEVWLKEADACPFCKTKLFETRNRTLRHQMALQANHILAVRFNIWDIQPFGAGPFRATPADIINLTRSNAIAFWWLESGHSEIQLITGTGYVNTSTLASSFAMMGNYIMAVSEARNLTYTAQQKEHWTLVLTTLWGVLRQYNGRVTDTSPHVFFKKLIRQLRRLPDLGHIQFIRHTSQSPDDMRLYSDLVCLLQFVAILTQNEHLLRHTEGLHHGAKKWLAKLKSVKRFFTPSLESGS